MVNSPTQIPACDPHSPAFLDLFISSGASDHVVLSIFIDFPINSKRNAQFHRIVYDYFRVDWDGLRAHLRDVP